MSRVLAALDDSSDAGPVLQAAHAVATLLGAEVYPIHVEQENDGPSAHNLLAESVVRSVGYQLHLIPGPLIEGVVRAGHADDVAAIVLGGRRVAADPRPLGSTAFAVATSASKPVVVVPPAAHVPETIRRLLVPVEGVPGSAGVPGLIAALTRHAQPEIIAVHVKLETDLPAFTDQPQHEHTAWSREFVRRYCDWHSGSFRLHTLVGRPEEQIPRVADQVDADVVVLAWSQNLNPGRAEVVRSVLRRCRRLILLMPVGGPAPATFDRMPP